MPRPSPSRATQTTSHSYLLVAKYHSRTKSNSNSKTKKTRSMKTPSRLRTESAASSYVRARCLVRTSASSTSLTSRKPTKTGRSTCTTASHANQTMLSCSWQMSMIFCSSYVTSEKSFSSWKSNTFRSSRARSQQMSSSKEYFHSNQ